MMITDEKLSAYIDGELALNEIEAIDKALNSDAALAARLAEMKRPDRLIAAAYGEIDKDPMPDRVMDLLRAAPGHAKSDNGKKIIRFPFQQFVSLPQQWATPIAAAVALAIGVGVGVQFISDNSPEQRENILLAGVIDAASPVHQALDSVPSSEAYSLNGGSITPVLTFKSREGDFCREFSVTSDAVTNRAVACRVNDQWVVQFAMVSDRNMDPGSFSTASAAASPAFDGFVDELMGDEPLASDDEAAIIKRQWRY